MAEEPNPTMARRELAWALNKARELRGYSAEQLSSFLGVSASQVSRLDSGVRGYQPNDVRRLAQWYGLSPSECDRLLELSTEARKRGWWQQIDLPDAYRALVGFEQAAEAISEYASFVPGLLQTERYARVMITSWDRDLASDAVEQAIETRRRRQGVLDRRPPPRLRIVIDEVALARAPRDPDIRREQFEHLLAMSSRPGVRVLVIGLEAGMHPAVGKQFILLEMGGRVPDVAYSESVLEPMITEQDEEVEQYRLFWDELRDVALDPTASRERIARYLAEIP